MITVFHALFLTWFVSCVSGVRGEDGAAAPAEPDPGTARHGQDGHLGHRGLPPGQADRRAGPRLRPIQHRRRPAHGEDTQDWTQGKNEEVKK